jgi:hypothetical protein
MSPQGAMRSHKRKTQGFIMRTRHFSLSLLEFRAVPAQKRTDSPSLSDALSEGFNLPAPQTRCVEQQLEQLQRGEPRPAAFQLIKMHYNGPHDETPHHIQQLVRVPWR